MFLLHVCMLLQVFGSIFMKLYFLRSYIFTYEGFNICFTKSIEFIFHIFVNEPILHFIKV